MRTVLEKSFHMETFRVVKDDRREKILAYLPAKKIYIVQASVPGWHAHLSHLPSHVSHYFLSSLKKELGLILAGTWRQLTHTITGKEAWTGTANIDSDLWAFCCVFQDADWWDLGKWGWEISTRLQLLRSCQHLTPTLPRLICAIASSSLVMFSFPLAPLDCPRVPPGKGMRGNWINQLLFLKVSFCLWRDQEEDPSEASQASTNTAAVQSNGQRRAPTVRYSFLCVYTGQIKIVRQLLKTVCTKYRQMCAVQSTVWSKYIDIIGGLTK